MFGCRAVLEKIFTRGIEDGSLRPDLDAEKETAYFSAFYCCFFTGLALFPHRSDGAAQPQIDAFAEKAMRPYMAKSYCPLPG